MLTISCKSLNTVPKVKSRMVVQNGCKGIRCLLLRSVTDWELPLPHITREDCTALLLDKIKSQNSKYGFY